jgi:hypothetical protein
MLAAAARRVTRDVCRDCLDIRTAKAHRSNDDVVARMEPICSDAKALPSCRAIFLIASPLLAVLLFGLLRMRLIK